MGEDPNAGSDRTTANAPNMQRGRSTGHWNLFPGNFRWVICAVLFIGISKNYMDRQVLGVLKTTLQQDLHWNEIDYSNLVFAFQAAYAVGMLAVGRFIDRVGCRLGYAVAVVFWSVASMAHAFCYSLGSFVVARSALGLGESCAFPASIKAVAEWFPQKERALAVGLFNAGSNLGAILTPLVVPWITLHFGWRQAFLLTGGLGFFWLLLWLGIYRRPEEHPSCTESELALIRSGRDEPASRVSWARILAHRQAWAFIGGKFLTDPVWWFYLFWVPGFLQHEHGLSLGQVGLPVVVIYLLSDGGSVAGGWLSSHLLKKRLGLNAARKIALLICAVAVLPIVYAYRAHELWTAVFLIGLAAAAHQGFSANLLTLPSDLFPHQAVASVVGAGGMAGAVGGMLVATIVGRVLQWTGSYFIPFLIAGFAYLAALGLIQALAPRLEPAEIG